MSKHIEMLDVLDENGIRSGEIRTRDDCHKFGLWHRCALLAIVNDDNKILIQQRSPGNWKFPGSWDLSVASHVQSGEDSLATVLRETNEEIGVQIGFRVEVRDFRFVTSFRNRHTNRKNLGGGAFDDIIENQFYDLFILRQNVDIDQVTFNDAEVSDIKFVDYTELMRLKNAGVLHPRTEWVDEIVRLVNRF